MQGLQNKIFRGKLQSKIFRLCICLVVISVIAFALVGIIEVRTIRKITIETGETQTGVIKQSSQESMMKVVEDALVRTAMQGAEISDSEFRILKHDSRQLARQVQDVLEHPENYNEIPVERPKRENGGDYSLQLLISDEDDLNDLEGMTMMRKLANLGPLMEESIRDNDDYVLDCYISLPSKQTLAMDKMSDKKFEEDGSIRLYDPTSRPWYQESVRTGNMYFSPAVHSYFYNLTEVVYGTPVYVDGELRAVLEGSVKLDKIQKVISEIEFGKSGFSILVSSDGQLVASPRETGELAMDNELSRDIRDTDNSSLKGLLDSALKLEKGFKEVTIDGEEFYAAYAPLETLGWTQMMFVSKQDLEASTLDLLKELDDLNAYTDRSYGKTFENAFLLTIAVMLVLLVTAGLAASFFSKRLVTPINVMTKQVKEIHGDNIHFEMDDIYRTGDEIEVLAESFMTLTDQLRNYISEVTQISAEKERMSSEMNVARKIQASMLPRIFPAFPEREEFDLYACMIPAKEVGGDFYDYFFIDTDHLAIIIGDVSGKGISAALFMVMTKHILQSQVMMLGKDVSGAMKSVNDLLMRDNVANMFVTIWLGVLTISTGHIRYVNAGHEYATVCRKDGSFKVEKDRHSPPVAASSRTKFRENELMLNPGDTLYLYTDGVTEAINSSTEMFGRERMLEALNQDIKSRPRELDDRVRNSIAEFVGDEDQFDDTTTLCIRYAGPKEK